MFQSKTLLFEYCREQARNSSLKKPAKRSASALPTAVGENRKGGSGDDNTDNEDDCDDDDDNTRKDDGGHKIGWTEEKKEEREEGCGSMEEEGAESGNDEVRRVVYKMVFG